MIALQLCAHKHSSRCSRGMMQESVAIDLGKAVTSPSRHGPKLQRVMSSPSCNVCCEEVASCLKAVELSDTICDHCSLPLGPRERVKS